MALVSLAELFGPAVREHLKTCNRITAHFRSISRKLRGCSLVVKPQSSKLMMRVRFPSSPPFGRGPLSDGGATDSPVHPPQRLRATSRDPCASGDSAMNFPQNCTPLHVAMSPVEGGSI